MMAIIQLAIVLVGVLALTTQFILGFAAIVCKAKEWAFAGVIACAIAYIVIRCAGADGSTCMMTVMAALWLGCLAARVISSPANGLLVIPVVLVQAWAILELMTPK